MAGSSGDLIASTLLRALPGDVVESLLGRLDAASTVQLRGHLATAGAPKSDDLDNALTEFFDLLRIAERGYPLASAAGEYRPVSGKKGEPSDAHLAEIRKLDADQLQRALAGEPPSAIALILSCLDPAVAAAVLKSLPQEQRADVTLRFTQPGSRNHTLIAQLAQAVAAKGRTLGNAPVDPTAEARITEMATMLRGMPRAERILVLVKVEETDPELATKIRERLYTFRDLLKVDNRGIQGLLMQLNMKTLSTALKGCDPLVVAKVTDNLSSRSRDLLQEEIGLLGSVNAAQVKQAQAEVLYVLRQFEEEGKITLEE